MNLAVFLNALAALVWLTLALFLGLEHAPGGLEALYLLNGCMFAGISCMAWDSYRGR